MSKQLTAGIDLDKLPRANGVSRDAEWPRALLFFFDRQPTDDEMRSLHELLARRAEPSVAADEHEEFNRWFHASGFTKYMDSMWAAWQARAALASPAVTEAMVDACYDHPERVPADAKRLMRETLERAFVASPAVSQKDGAADDCTEPNREACPRLCGDFCNAAEEQRSATTASASCQCRACKSGMTHTSDCAVHNEPAEPNGPCNCGVTAPSREAVPTSGMPFNLMVARACPDEIGRWGAAQYEDGRRAALARAPLPAEGDGKKCQYPNCGCTSRATCNFNYDAAPAQAPLPATAIAKVVETDIDISVIDAVLPIGTPLYAAPAQAGDALDEFGYLRIADEGQTITVVSDERFWSGDSRVPDGMYRIVADRAAMSASQDQKREAK